MGLIILSDIQELPDVAPDNVCVVKGVLTRTLCDEIVNSLDLWRRQRTPNEGRGTNWWYHVEQEGSQFVSFLFWKLHELNPLPLREDLVRGYSALFEAHTLCQTVPLDADFNSLLTHRGDAPSFEPLIFHYGAGTGKFRRHAHVQGYQKTQVLINLTKRNRDYTGGETLIEEPDGAVVELGEVFDQGDMFSFPYPLFHSVQPVCAPKTGSGIGRASMLMPYHPRTKTEIRY